MDTDDPRIWLSTTIALLDRLPEPAVMVGADGRIAGRNPAAADLDGGHGDRPQHLTDLVDEATAGAILALQPGTSGRWTGVGGALGPLIEARALPDGHRLLCAPRDPAATETLPATSTTEAMVEAVLHDVNDLLTAVLAHADEIHLALPDGRRTDDHLGAMLLAAERAERTTRALTALLSPKETTARDLELGELMISLQEVFRRLTPSHLSVHVALAPDGAWIHADPAALRRSLVDLVRLAGRHATSGAPLELILRGPRDDGDPVQVTLRGRSLVHAAADAVLDRLQRTVLPLLEPGSEASVLPDQTGVLLSIPARPAGSDGPSGAVEGPEHVLLVDDDKAVRIGLGRGLQELGYEVTTLVRAEDARALLESDETVDVLVTDVDLPEMNGLSLAVHARRARPDLPVVVASGYPRYADHFGADLLAAGVAFLEKPFTPSELARMVRKLLGSAPTSAG